VLPPDEIYLPPERLRERLNARVRVDVVPATHEHAISLGTQPAPDLPLNRKGEEPGTSLRHFLASYRGRVLIAADSAGRREALNEQLAAAGLRPLVLDGWRAFLDGDEALAITVASLEQGFALDAPRITVLTERELFGERVRTDRKKRRGATNSSCANRRTAP